MQQMKPVGVLAYGSLINDPGPELELATVRRLDTETPFHIEFARSSSKRGGAPTLVPVESGGSRVAAVVLVMEQGIGRDKAADMLWRRETSQTESSKRYLTPTRITENTVVVKELPEFAGLDVVLYTWITANIEPLTADRLAELAWASACGTAGGEKRDGISYLIQAQQADIATPLMPAYEEAILQRSGAKTIDQAWQLATRQQ